MRAMALVMSIMLLLGPLAVAAGAGSPGRDAGPRAPMADLTVVPGSYGFSPANPTVGDEVMVNFTIANIGDADTDAGFAVEFFINDTSHPFKPGENEIDLGPMPKGEAWNVSQFWGTNDLVSGINYTIIIVIDPGNKLNESNKTNNRMEVNQSLGPRLYPELYIPPGGVSVRPSKPFIGDNVTVNATVGNKGEKTAKFVDVFFYVNSTSDQIGNYDIIGPLNVSGSKNASVVWNTTGRDPGNYTILVMVNPPWDWNRMLERNYSDNNASVNVTLSAPKVPMPDLRLSNVTHMPPAPKVGDTAVVMADVVNAGDGASAPCNLSLFLDYNITPVARVLIPAMQPHEVRSFVLSWNSSGLNPMVHKMRLVADEDFDIADSNRSNNTFSWNWEFYGQIDLLVENLNITPAAPRLGDNVTFSVRVLNAGTLRCNDANLTLSVGGTVVDRKQLIALGPSGFYQNLTLKWSTGGLVPGNYDFEINVAPGPGQADSNPGNNLLSGQIVLQPPPPGPDLRVASVVLTPATIRNGDIMVVRVVVENAGDLDANGSFLDIKLGIPNGGLFNFTASPVTVPSIIVGRSATVNITRDTSNFRAATYSMRVTVDFNADVTETNESNNLYITELQILEAIPKLPRLGVQEIILDGKVEENQKVNIFVMVNNTGDADAYNVTVNFFIDGRLAGSKPISIIAMQANRTASWDWVPSAGKHNITVTVSGDSAGTLNAQRSVEVPAAPSGTGPYILAAGIGMLAIVLAVVLYRAIGRSGRPGPRIRLIDEEDDKDGAEGDEHGEEEKGEEGGEGPSEGEEGGGPAKGEGDGKGPKEGDIAKPMQEK